MDVGSKRAAAEAGLAPSSVAAPQRVAVGSSEFNEHFLRFFYCAWALCIPSSLHPAAPTPPLRLSPPALCCVAIAAKLYPFKLMFRWLSYGNGARVRVALASRRRTSSARTATELGEARRSRSRKLLQRLTFHFNDLRVIRLRSSSL